MGHLSCLIRLVGDSERLKATNVITMHFVAARLASSVRSIGCGRTWERVLVDRSDISTTLRVRKGVGGISGIVIGVVGTIYLPKFPEREKEYQWWLCSQLDKETGVMQHRTRAKEKRKKKQSIKEMKSCDASPTLRKKKITATTH